MLLFVDVETHTTPTASLATMSLYQYLQWVSEDRERFLGVAWAVDDDEVQWNEGWPTDEWLREVAEFVQDPENIVVAHNAAFDVRVLTQVLGLPYPERVRCTLELAYAAWPNQPGANDSPNAYSLASLAITQHLGLEKLNMQEDPLDDYCKRDVELCRRLYHKAVRRLSPQELQVAEMAQAIREICFVINKSAVAESVALFDEVVLGAAEEAAKILGDEGFGREGQRVKSVKPHVVKQQILQRLGIDIPTISYKKLNPQLVAANPQLATALKAVAEANKSLSHRRRVSVFLGSDRVYCELGYARAHTFRYSSPSVGKGLNLHNCPKRNKKLAKAFRTLFAFPENHCAVRADLSNVEYRGACFLAKSKHASKLFEADVLADPYIAFWKAATGQTITKKDPARQVAKAAVLGLSYLMGQQTWVSELLKALADPSVGLTVADFERIASENGWTLDRYGRMLAGKLHAPEAVVRVAQGTHAAFHAVHPELKALAEWLELAVTVCCRAIDPVREIDELYQHPSAPDRKMVDLVWEDTADMPRSLRVRVGDWYQPTVTWRDIGVRKIDGYGVAAVLSSRQTGSKGYRALTKNILIENVVQAWARNALVKGKLALWELGYRYLLSVHDEIMVVVPQEDAAVRAARDAILKVYGPGNGLGYSWAVVVNPAEVTVSRTLYEEELPPDWWNQHPLPLHLLP